jgi:hypothetical protein
MSIDLPEIRSTNRSALGRVECPLRGQERRVNIRRFSRHNLSASKSLGVKNLSPADFPDRLTAA